MAAKIVAASADAYDLFHDGIIALSQVEANGIRVDVPYIRKTRRQLQIRLDKLLVELKNSHLGKMWKKTHKRDLDPNEDRKLARVLFKTMKMEPLSKTKKGAPQVNDKVLNKLSKKHKDLKKWLRYKKLYKARNTFLKGILNEQVDGFLHPFFDLHKVASHRSSSSCPNFQNFPARDPEIKKLVRRAFVPRKGHLLLEIDGKGMEVSFATCYHKDPVMIKYLNDDSLDMHRDMAMEIYRLKKNQVTKLIRYVAKNRFTFPEFYGSYHAQVGPELWNAIEELNLELEDGTCLKYHLKQNGIKSKAAFLKHIEKVEKDFWGKRFVTYTRWKEKWYKDYLKNGGFRTLTGFWIDGILKKNQAINFPVQGIAFHALLWALIRMQKWLVKNDKKTKIVGQIHDSMVLDVHPSELKLVLKKLNYYMTQAIKKEWQWINVPLTVEPELTPVDGSWYEKEEVKLEDYI